MVILQLLILFLIRIPPIKYARANDATGTSFGPPVVVRANTFAAISPSLQIINGKPAIAFFDYNYRTQSPFGNDLTYVTAIDASGMAWGTTFNLDDAGEVGLSPSLQEVNGSAAISYYDRTNSKIKYIGPNQQQPLQQQ